MTELLTDAFVGLMLLLALIGLGLVIVNAFVWLRDRW